MAVDAIIFDLDGTLLDTNVLHARAWTEAMERFGYRVGEDRILKEIGKSGSLLVPSLLGDRVEAEQGDALREAHDRLFLRLVDREEIAVFPGAEETLLAAREQGLKTAVATGSAREGVEKMADASGLDLFGLVDVVVTDSDVERGKPEPDTITAAIEKLDLSPAQFVFIGDTPYDVVAGRAAGVVTLCVGTGAHDREKLFGVGARAVYADVGELGRQMESALKLSSPGRVHLTWATMRALMDEALQEARDAVDSDNVPVGAVIADGDGEIVARGHSVTETTGNFLQHAEMVAFQKVVGKVRLNRRELILVSTLEPCMMCMGAAMDARVDTIIYGLGAPSNGGARRCEPMQSPGMIMPRIVGGVCEQESRALFEEWSRLHPETPFVQDLLMRV